MPPAVLYGCRSTREIGPDALLGRPDPAVCQELLQRLEEPCIDQSNPISENVDGNRVSCADVLPEGREFECGNMQPLGDLQDKLLADHSVSLHHLSGELYRNVINDQEDVDVSSYRMLLFARSAAEDDHCLEKMAELLRYLGCKVVCSIKVALLVLCDIWIEYFFYSEFHSIPLPSPTSRAFIKLCDY